MDNKNELTLGDIEKYIGDIFNHRVESSRKITGVRGCKTYGWININSLRTCSDPECESCKVLNGAVNNTFKKQVPKQTDPHNDKLT